VPTLVDDAASTAFQWFGAGPYPYFVFVDRAGNVALRLSGEIAPADLAELMNQLEAS
jgi:hypothetical protein